MQIYKQGTFSMTSDSTIFIQCFTNKKEGNEKNYKNIDGPRRPYRQYSLCASGFALQTPGKTRKILGTCV